MSVTVARLRELLTYDPQAGDLRWQRRYSNAIPADLSAGYIDFPESKQTGKDNCAWHRFHAQHVGGPRFYPQIAEAA